MLHFNGTCKIKLLNPALNICQQGTDICESIFVTKELKGGVRDNLKQKNTFFADFLRRYSLNKFIQTFCKL